MMNLLLRNVPAGVVAALDAGATRLGISRNEFILRRLGQELRQSHGLVTEEHLQNLLQLLPDLADVDLMDAGWRQRATD